jgi:hydroxypyruvate isomerase
MDRRAFLASMGAAAAAAMTAERIEAQAERATIKRKGRIKQSLFRTVFGQDTPGLTTLDEQCREAARLGAYGFELIQPSDWPTLKKYGLAPTMAPMIFTTIPDGIVSVEKHDALEKALRAEVDTCVAGGCEKIISFAGQRKSMSYEQGLDNCTLFLNRVKRYLEDRNITLCIENTNSKYPDNVLGRPDQLCDHAAWGFELCKRVNSPRVKMLYDIYHAQVQDGNVVATIRDNIQWIAHFHTAGVPGRHEIDETQELNYRLVAQTIADLGFTGYVAHEYRPSPGRDPIKSIETDMAILDV